MRKFSLVVLSTAGLLLTAAVAVAIMLAPPAAAQQVVELDFANGRTIISDEWQREMHSDVMAVDWERSILYVRDAEEPEGIMAFSLETGEWLRTLLTPIGEGPHEFPNGARAVDVAPHGGIYASGFIKVVEFDRADTPINSWRPVAPTTWSVCDFGGQPAVPTQGGVVRRRADGNSEEIGPVRARGVRITASRDVFDAVSWRVLWSRLACTDDQAYVVVHSERGADSVFVYNRDGSAHALPLPTEGIRGMTECRPMRAIHYRPGVNTCPVGLSNLYPSFDDRGNLVLLGFDNKVHGVIINPETGCHALIQNTTRLYNIPARVYADSALVFHMGTVEVEHDGKIVEAFRDAAHGVSMVPFRRISGQPCPGMLPSVNWG
ncbi:MAG: hypothetical protein OXF01_03210 [Gemmatimonadetes bacterium]|nr:hypothetical protein [Gemmatimonadota bacterium]